MHQSAFEIIDDLLVVGKRPALQSVLNYCPVAIAVFDRDLRYLAASERWIHEMGLTGQNVIGQKHYDVVPEIRKKEDWLEQHQRVLNGEIIKGEAERFERGDGRVQYVWRENRPWYDAEGKVGGIKMFVQILNDKYDPSAERRRKTFWRKAPKEEKIGHWSLDLINDEFHCSPEVYGIFGLNEDNTKLDLDMALDIYVEDEREKVENALFKAIENKRGFAYKSRILKASGEECDVYAQGKCRLDDNNQAIELFGIIQNISAT